MGQDFTVHGNEARSEKCRHGMLKLDLSVKVWFVRMAIGSSSLPGHTTRGTDVT